MTRSLSFLLSIVLFTSNYADGQFEPSDDGGGFTESDPSGNDVGGAGETAGTFEADEEATTVTRSGGQSYTVQEYAIADPKRGPTDTYVYKNQMGLWKLPPVAKLTTPMSGSANYRWYDNSANEDQLSYISHGHVTDQGGYLIPRGTKVSVWAFMATDDEGDTAFFYFGTDAVIDAPQGRRYPVYYSYGPPGKNNPVMRLTTRTGTERL